MHRQHGHLSYAYVPHFSVHYLICRTHEYGSLGKKMMGIGFSSYSKLEVGKVAEFHPFSTPTQLIQSTQLSRMWCVSGLEYLPGSVKGGWLQLRLEYSYLPRYLPTARFCKTCRTWFILRLLLGNPFSCGCGHASGRSSQAISPQNPHLGWRWWVALGRDNKSG